MATRRDARRYGDTTTDNFEKVGNGEDEVDNASGQRSPYTIDLPRDREITPPPPGQHLSPRVPLRSTLRPAKRWVRTLRRASRQPRAASSSSARPSTRLARAKGRCFGTSSV